jgi:hypothetical protein
MMAITGTWVYERRYVTLKSAIDRIGYWVSLSATHLIKPLLIDLVVSCGS